MPSPGSPIPKGNGQAGRTRSIRDRIHLLARWLDRPDGRNWLNILLFAATAAIAYLWLGRPSPSWQLLYSPVGALFIGLPLVGILLSLRSLAGPRIASRFRRWWRALVIPPLDSAVSDSTDVPIRQLTDDRLGFSRYAALLARRVIDPHEKTPLTIGIHGPWGSGKTSMVGLVQDYLKLTRYSEELTRFDQDPLSDGRLFSEARPESNPSGRLIRINFNAWQYGDARSLWRVLILALIDKHREMGLPIDPRLWERRLYWSVDREAGGALSLGPTSVLRAFSAALLPWLLHLVLPTTWVAWLIGGTKPSSLGDFLQSEKVKGMRKQMSSTEEFQDAINALISALRRDRPERKIVFFIDDLDRCLPDVALKIVEAIKAFLDIEGCAYVFACDQALLSEGVRARLLPSVGPEGDLERRGREYLEKLIQVGFEIPRGPEDAPRASAPALPAFCSDGPGRARRRCPGWRCGPFRSRDSRWDPGRPDAGPGSEARISAPPGSILGRAPPGASPPFCQGLLSALCLARGHPEPGGIPGRKEEGGQRGGLPV